MLDREQGLPYLYKFSKSQGGLYTRQCLGGEDLVTILAPTVSGIGISPVSLFDACTVRATRHHRKRTFSFTHRAREAAASFLVCSWFFLLPAATVLVTLEDVQEMNGFD